MLNTPLVYLQFLGTGTSTGVPMIACKCEVCTSSNTKDKRLRCSVLLNVEGVNILIDTSPDLRHQFLKNNINNIDAILITHSHKDHLSGLDDVRAINHFQKKRIPLYTNQQTIDAIHRDFYYAFEEHKYPGLFEVDLHLIEPNKIFYIHNIPIIPIYVQHAKMEVLGFRIFDITYITDASFIPSLELEKIKGSKILILNALRHKPHHSHFNLSQAIVLSQQLNIPQVYFTHISHQIGMHEDVIKTLPPSITLAYDGLVISNH